jgi:hypothetical protein
MKFPYLIVVILFALTGCAYNAEQERSPDTDSISFQYEVKDDTVDPATTKPDPHDQSGDPDSANRILNEKFRAGKLDGQVDYNFSRQMKVGTSEVVSVVISKNYPREKVISEVQSFHHQDSIKRTVVKIAPMVVVVLQEANTGTFVIKPRFLSPQQPVFLNDSSYTEFSWDVTPLKEGEHKLTFHINLLIENNPAPVYSKSFDGVILVRSDRSVFGKFFLWIEDHWTIVAWVISGLFAIFGWLYKEKIIRFFGKADKPC